MCKSKNENEQELGCGSEGCQREDADAAEPRQTQAKGRGFKSCHRKDFLTRILYSTKVRIRLHSFDHVRDACWDLNTSGINVHLTMKSLGSVQN